jgi:hypothetical protein
MHQQGSTVTPITGGGKFPRRIETIGWPGDDSRTVAILYLVAKETQDAYFGARKHFEANSQAVDMAAGFQFELEHTYQLVQRMLLDPVAKDPEKKLFKTTDDVRRRLTPNEIDWFVAAHERIQKGELLNWKREDQFPQLRELAALLKMEGASDEDILNATVSRLSDSVTE